jgi:hypothetical protein
MNLLVLQLIPFESLIKGIGVFLRGHHACLGVSFVFHITSLDMSLFISFLFFLLFYV